MNRRTFLAWLAVVVAAGPGIKIEGDGLPPGPWTVCQSEWGSM